MRYTELKLVEGYKEVTQKFAQEAEAEQVKKAIDQYRELVNRDQVQGNERNIDWWGKQGWERFRTFVNAKSQQQSVTQQKKRKNTGRSHTLAENDQWLIVVPLDKDASCFHGKDTDWCTTKPDHDYFHQYFLNSSVTLIYFLQKQTGAKWAAAVYPDGEEDYLDKNDNSIGKDNFSKQTGIPLDTVMKYVDMVSNKSTDVAKKANKARSEHQKQVDKMFQLLNRFTKGPSGVKDPELENYIVKYGGLEQEHVSAKEIYFTHLLKKPVELDTRMQKVFTSMWTNPDEMEDPPDNEEELIKNVTNLSDKSKYELSPYVDLDVFDNMSDKLQEKLLDRNIFRFINETDIPLKDRHIKKALQITLKPLNRSNADEVKDMYTERLMNRVEYDRIRDALQDATKTVLVKIKDFSNPKSSAAYQYFFEVLDRLEKIAEKIDYDPDPIVDWAVETYDIDYF